MKDRIRSAFSEIHADEALMNNTAAYLHRELGKRRLKNKRLALPRLAGAFAAVTVFILGIFSCNLYFTADAYVSIDVNPSIELTINRFDKVIAAHAFNEDGERILSEAGLQGKSYKEAAGLIMSCMENDGYLTDDVLISVTIQTVNSERERLLCSALQQFIGEQALSAQSTADVEVFPVSAEVWGNARGCNMSPAKYMAIKELLEVDKEATIEAYSDCGISQIRRRAQECRDAHGFEADDSNYGSALSDEHEHGQGHGHGQGKGHALKNR